ncbi:MAG: glycoside hydrolase family 3 C-terminal domain-containing protein [Planctomycetes bacterium]|nr:glycoside hydrolase family 3 C-terminal domain-containing protein [Planctomycetota bacterium]
MKIRTLSILLLICVIILCAAYVSAGAGQRPQGLKKLSIEDKIEKLLRKMTIEEKIGQMTQYSWRSGSEDYHKHLRRLAGEGKVGSFLNLTPGICVKERNELQKIATEQSPSGIPLIFGFDVIHGYRTVFPIPLAQSCMWDLDLAAKAASVAAAEASSDGYDWTFAPMVDIARDPRWGRIAESFGEDPYLASVFAAAKVRGFQGRNLADPRTLVACLKHYAAYGAAEAGKDYNTCEVSERTLREVYLPPFKAGVDAGAATLMSGFNEISGIPTSGNRHILTDILRDEWKFDGFVVSDYNSVAQLITHGFAEDYGDAAQKAATAGVDMVMESEKCLKELQRLVKTGKVSEKVIDQAVRRILRIKFRAGLFDHPYVDPNLSESVILSKEHLQTAREVAKKSMVLLKNDSSLLPLRKDIKTLALIGPLADNQKDLLGTWAGAGRSGDVVTVRKAIREKLLPQSRLLYAKGCGIQDDSTEGFNEAVKIANQSDMVILAVGESEKMSGEGHSRAYLDLPEVQKKLVKKIHATGKPVIVVLFSGRPLSISWLKENIPAILLAWHPGVQGGNAVADILFGDYNPSGKLTTTFPRTVGQVPIYYNHKNTGRPPREKDRYTSRYIDISWTPLFPFGYGLSYTTFEYKNLKVNPNKIVLGQPITVTIDVQNTGERAGEEVVQLYIRDLVASVTRPVKELKGFRKISLKPKQKKKVSFTITSEQLSFCNQEMKFVTEPGDFKIWVGPDSVRGLQGDFKIVPPK